MDMWSIGCVVYELFTGRILFPGGTNNEMVRLFMDVKGPFTKKMLRKCAFADRHFEMQDPNSPFISVEVDPITKNKVSTGGAGGEGERARLCVDVRVCRAGLTAREPQLPALPRGGRGSCVGGRRACTWAACARVRAVAGDVGDTMCACRTGVGECRCASWCTTRRSRRDSRSCWRAPRGTRPRSRTWPTCWTRCGAGGQGP